MQVARQRDANFWEARSVTGRSPRAFHDAAADQPVGIRSRRCPPDPVAIARVAVFAVECLRHGPSACACSMEDPWRSLWQARCAGSFRLMRPDDDSQKLSDRYGERGSDFEDQIIAHWPLPVLKCGDVLRHRVCARG